MSGSIWGNSGVSFGQASSLLQAPLPSQRWTGPRCFSATNAAVAANTLYACPFIPLETFTCDQLGIRVATGAAGSAKLGIYTALTTTLMPDALVAEVSADIDTTSIATPTVGFAANPTFTVGKLYYLASCYSVTPTMVCWNHTVAQNGGFLWPIGSAIPGPWLVSGGTPARITRTAALTYVAGSAFFPASFGAATEGAGTPGSPLVAIRKL